VLEQAIESILATFKLATNAVGLEPLFIEDGNPAHGHKSISSVCTKWRKAYRIVLFPHPASSPDMNPIEKCWRRIKQALHRRNRQPTNKQEMRDAVTEE
jgi:transposase